MVFDAQICMRSIWSVKVNPELKQLKIIKNKKLINREQNQ